MSLVRPNAQVTIDGRTLSAAEAALVSLQVDLALNGAHDAALLQVWPASKFAGTTPGATISIALGDRGSEVDVLAGEVTDTRAGPAAVRIDALAATVALSRTRVSKAYVDQSVADIVRDLAGGAAVDRIDATLKVGAWHADNRLPVWQQLQRLAALTGSDLGAAADGSLRFVPAAGAGQPTRLRHGAELLDWSLGPAHAPEAPAVFAHGAGSEAGSAKWHWLRHSPAGGDPARVVGALATRDAADAAGQALADRAARGARRGRLLVVGQPKLRPGDAVELADLPGDDPGTLRIVAVRHRLDAVSGFLTRLDVEAADGGGGGFP